MRCPYCGDQHSDQASFCPRTGKILNQPDVCQNCGASLPSEVSFCPICGTAVNTTDSHLIHPKVGQALTQHRVQLALIFCAIFVVGIVAIMSKSWPSKTPTQQPSNVDTYTQAFTNDETQDTLLLHPTNTPSHILTPTMTPTNGPWTACENSYLSRLHIGDRAYVAHQPPLANRVRSEPNLDSKIIGHIQPGEYVKILKGPTCANQWVWWYVRANKDGLKGWTSEGDIENYWLNPSP